MTEFTVRTLVDVPQHLIFYKMQQRAQHSMFISVHDENNDVVYTGVVRPVEEDGVTYLTVKLFDKHKNAIMRKSPSTMLVDTESIAREMLHLTDLCVKEFENGQTDN